MTTNPINIENKELIEKYEKLGIEVNKIFMELVSRRKSNELTDLEWNHLIEIASRRGAELVIISTLIKKISK